MLIDFQNSFTDLTRLISKFAIKSLLNSPSHLKVWWDNDDSFTVDLLLNLSVKEF